MSIWSLCTPKSFNSEASIGLRAGSISAPSTGGRGRAT